MVSFTSLEKVRRYVSDNSTVGTVFVSSLEDGKALVAERDGEVKQTVCCCKGAGLSRKSVPRSRATKRRAVVTVTARGNHG